MCEMMNNRMCYLVCNTVERRARREEQRDRERQGERGRAGEEQCKDQGKLLTGDLSDWCRIFFCGLQVVFLSC